MADTKISALPAAANPAITDEYETNQGGVSKKITSLKILNSIPEISLESGGSAGFASSKIGFNADGSATFASNRTNLTADGGANFLSGDATVTPAVVATGAILQFAVNNAGTGYTVNDLVTADGGNNDATFFVDSIDGGGGITALVPGDAGTGYVIGGTTVSGGTGNSAEINIIEVDTGAPASVTVGVTNPGRLRVQNAGTDVVILSGAGDFPFTIASGGVRKIVYDAPAGNLTFDPDGAATIRINVDGSTVFATGQFTIFSSGAVGSLQDIEISDTAKGVILKSSGGNRFRIKVNDAGILSTEAA